MIPKELRHSVKTKSISVTWVSSIIKHFQCTTMMHEASNIIGDVMLSICYKPRQCVLNQSASIELFEPQYQMFCLSLFQLDHLSFAFQFHQLNTNFWPLEFWLWIVLSLCTCISVFIGPSVWEQTVHNGHNARLTWALVNSLVICVRHWRVCVGPVYLKFNATDWWEKVH